MPRRKTKTNREAGNELETVVYSTTGETIGKISLPEEIFGVKVNPVLLATAVRVYLANQRLGTHSSKTRAEVIGSTRKIYRQKGTGRARHGDIKAPIFIGGGIAHGPKPRDYSLNLPKKTKKLALFSALTSKFQGGEMKIVAGLEKIEAKTKMVIGVLRCLNFMQPKEQKAHSTLLILPEIQKNIILAGRNLSGLSITQARLLNTYDVLAHRNLLFTKEAIPIIQEHFTKKSKILPNTSSSPSVPAMKSTPKRIKSEGERGKTALRRSVRNETKTRKPVKPKTEVKPKKLSTRKIKNKRKLSQGS